MKSKQKIQNETRQSNNEDKTSFPISHKDWLLRAKEILDSAPFDYVESGAGTEATLGRNQLAFSLWQIQPKLLQDVSSRDLSVPLFGRHLKHPVMLAPVGNQSIVNPDADLASARAARETKTPYTVSTVSSVSLEEIAVELGDAPKFFQLYWTKDIDITESLVQRAEKSGYDAIFLTIDTPVFGRREKDLTNDYDPLGQGHGVANFFSDPVFRREFGDNPEENANRAMEYVTEIIDEPELKWEDLVFLREKTKLPIVLKGVLHPDDAVSAVKAGIDGIVVSNHGGRQLDGSVATMEVLPEIRQAVPAEFPILLDSGIRSGADVIKAIALGANAVLVGRPYVYGLAVGGYPGVKKVIENMLDDIDTTLAVGGRSSIRELDSSLLRKGEFY